MKLTITFALLALLLSACSTSRPLTSSQGLQVMPGTSLPPPTGADIYGSNSAYLIGPFDKLRIDVYGIPDLSQRIVAVDASGRISFPLVGEVEVAGKAPNQVSDILRQSLRGRFIRDPQVTVNLEQTASQVTVDGEVREPGLYPVIGRMTLLRTIATAKGLGEFAKQEDVVVFRTVGGQKMAALYNLRAIRDGAYEDPQIFANDVVVVGDSPGRRIFRDVVNGAALITTPLLILFR